MAGVSQLGRTRRSGGRSYFAGFGIGGYGFLIGGLGAARRRLAVDCLSR
jgi:hypothetical protein